MMGTRSGSFARSRRMRACNRQVFSGSDVEKKKILKCRRVIGHQLVLRDANPEDASFILGLRLDESKGRYLSKVAPDLQPQVEWLARYQADVGQAYFIIENKAGERFGTVRLYDAVGDSFCWGSWLLRAGSPTAFAIESALIVYRYAMSLGFSAAHFDVRKDNRSVWQFHERFGAMRLSESGTDYFYSIDEAAIHYSLSRYARFLPHGIQVVPG